MNAVQPSDSSGTSRLTRQQLGAFVEKMVLEADTIFARTQDSSRWPVQPGSSLARDDRDTDPYHLSHAVRGGISSSAEHLHAFRTLVVDARILQPQAGSRLCALPSRPLPGPFWLLNPPDRSTRVTRAHLRAHDRVVVALPAVDEAWILLVGPHRDDDPGRNVYDLLYQLAGVAPPEQARRETTVLRRADQHAAADRGHRARHARGQCTAVGGAAAQIALRRTPAPPWPGTHRLSRPAPQGRAGAPDARGFGPCSATTDLGRSNLKFSQLVSLHGLGTETAPVSRVRCLSKGRRYSRHPEWRSSAQGANRGRHPGEPTTALLSQAVTTQREPTQYPDTNHCGDRERLNGAVPGRHRLSRRRAGPRGSRRCRR